MGDTQLLRPVGWAGVVGGAALVVVGTALVRVGRTDIALLEGADAGTVWDDVEPLYERSPRFMRAGGVLIGLGGAAAITGAVLVVRARGTGEDEDDGPSVQARVAPRGAQLEVTW